MERSFSVRAVATGLFIGVFLNLSNTYYGLQTGVGNQMAMVSALLGYVLFQIGSRYTTIQLTAGENVLIISAATATGCMPITAGFTGVVPALEYVLGPEENGPFPIAWKKLVLWSLGLCFFGLIFASLLRDRFVVRENLPWPGPKAVAHLINTLHKKTDHSPSFVRHELDPDLQVEPITGDQNESVARARTIKENPIDWNARMNVLFKSSFISGIISVILYFLPILRRIPIFGWAAASKWLWTADLSPGFIGQGIITGLVIPSHMLLGAVVGWGFLSPFAKYKGWAPGAVDDWENGSRGWTIWISLAALMADASVKLSWFFLGPLWNHYCAKVDLNQWTFFSKKSQSGREVQPCESQQLIGQSGTSDDSEECQEGSSNTNSLLHQDNRCSGVAKPESVDPVASKTLWLSFLFSILACAVAMHFIFGNIIAWYHTILAVVLSLPMAVVGIRSIAETDYNPESALVSQLVFATLISRSNPNAIIFNIISAGISQAGSNQAGDIAYDFKVGHLVAAQPQAQLYGQIIGSIFGAFISCGIYELYASQYPIPGPFFRVPSAFLDVSTAKLVMGRGLPQGVAPWALGTIMIFLSVTIMKIRFASRWWQNLVPGGVAFAIGIYNMPSFTIARFLGGVTYWGYCQRHKGQEKNIIVFASGLVLGESIASLVNLALAAMHVPQLTV